MVKGSFDREPVVSKMVKFGNTVEACINNTEAFCPNIATLPHSAKTWKARNI